MPIYLDIIWFLNFLFDSLLLLITAIILKRHYLKWKIFLAGLIGSLIIFIPFTPMSQFFSSPFFKIAISIIMVWVSFGFKNFRYYFTNLFVFYLCTFVAGGALFGIHYLAVYDMSTIYSIASLQMMGFGDPISWLFVILGFPVAIYFSKKTFDKFEIVKIQGEQIMKVTLYIRNQSIDLIGLLDTGNQLYDPITKRPVMIVSLEKTSHLFPKELISIFHDANQIMKNSQLELDEWMDKISIIPYRVVGQENRLIAAIRPDMIEIKKDEIETYQTNQVLLAFVNQKLSSDDQFDCIIHPKIIQSAHSKQVS